jgi:nucleoside-diphosphate-sugar epimerase
VALVGGEQVRILVTGGAGLVGSHLCARLLRDGHVVVCADNLLTGSERNIGALREQSAFTFVRQDVCEPGAFAELGRDDLDAIFHLASPASPVGYWTHPFETIRVNSEGTHRMLELARRTGARFLFASTSEAYGDPEVHPQVETYWGHVNPIGIRACYDESKRLGETITMEHVRQYGADARIVRIFNTYGPHNQLDDGRMIPNFIVAALQGKPLTIHGTGQQTRSICYVEDLVDGLTRALFQPGTTGEVYNLGNPDEHSVLEWAQMIVRLCDSSSELVFAAKREDDPERRRPDIEKARRELGWQPQISPHEGLGRTIAWVKSELERATPEMANPH